MVVWTRGGLLPWKRMRGRRWDPVAHLEGFLPREVSRSLKDERLVAQSVGAPRSQIRRDRKQKGRCQGLGEGDLCSVGTELQLGKDGGICVTA